MVYTVWTHHETMLLISKGALYNVLVSRPHRVLDIGTGTEIWSIDYAVQHPEAQVSYWIRPEVRPQHRSHMPGYSTSI